MKRQLPLAIVIILGFVFVFYTFVPHKILADDFFNWYMNWSYAMAPFGMLLGVISLVMSLSIKISRRVPKWQFSIVTLLGLLATSIAGFGWGIQSGTPFMWIFQNMQMPMSSTMFSLLAFYIASAAYKAFRARSPEATVLLGAAIVVMLAQVPIGMQISKYLPDVSQWILNVPNLAAKRGILLGVGLGSVATSLKILLGIERSYLGGGE